MKLKTLAFGALAAIAMPMAASAVTITPPLGGDTGTVDTTSVPGLTITTFDFVNSPLSEGDSELINLTFTAADDTFSLAIINFDVTDGSALELLAVFEPGGPNVIGDSSIAIGGQGAASVADVEANTFNTPIFRMTGGPANGVGGDADGLVATDFDNAVSGFPPAEILFDGTVSGTGRAVYVFWDSYNPAAGDDGSLLLTITAVPLPAGLVLMLTALGGLGFVGRFRSKQTAAA